MLGLKDGGLDQVLCLLASAMTTLSFTCSPVFALTSIRGVLPVIREAISLSLVVLDISRAAGAHDLVPFSVRKMIGKSSLTILKTHNTNIDRPRTGQTFDGIP